MNKPTFICHCCSCCCEVLRALNESGVNAVSPSNFEPRIDSRLCAGCEECVRRCPVTALSPGEGGVVIDVERCIGCGVCAQTCPSGAIEMARRSKIVEPPATKMEQMARIGREKADRRKKA